MKLGHGKDLVVGEVEKVRVAVELKSVGAPGGRWPVCAALEALVQQLDATEFVGELVVELAVALKVAVELQVVHFGLVALVIGTEATRVQFLMLQLPVQQTELSHHHLFGYLIKNHLQ